MTCVQEEDFWHTLELLPRVLTHIASTDPEITDDTCLEKLMSWFQSSSRDKDKLCHLLNSSTMQFLKSVSSPDMDCSSSCLNFALKLLPSLVTSIANHSHEKQMREKTATVAVVCIKEGNGAVNIVPSKSMPHQSQDSHASASGIVGSIKREVVNDQDVGIFCNDLVTIGTDLLKKCLERDYWDNVSIRNSWILAVAELVNESEWIPVLDDGGAFVKAVELLKDQSMFVVKAAHLFLAKIILLSGVTTEMDSVELKQSSNFTDVSSLSPSEKRDIDSQILEKEIDISCQSNVAMTIPLKDGSGHISCIPSMKRKLRQTVSTFDGDIPSKVTKHSQQVTVSSKQVQCEHSKNKEDSSVILSKWKTGIMQFILLNGETLSCGKDSKLDPSLLSCQDHVVASSVGILSHLLRISPKDGINLIAKCSLVHIYCTILQEKDIRPTLAKAVLQILCLFLEKSTDLLSLPADPLSSQIDSILGVMLQHLLKTRNWKHLCQLIPALLGVCSKVDHVKCCLPDKTRNNLKMVTSVLMASLKVSVEDVNQTGVKESQLWPSQAAAFFQGATKQELYSMKYYSLVCLEKIILEGSLNWIGGCTELLESLRALLAWISCQQLAFSKQKVDRFLKQYLDVVKAFQEKEAEPSWFLPIMQSVLQLISNSDCDNTVLNKGLQLLKFHILHGQSERQLDEDQPELMVKAKHALEKHLMSPQWEARDSAINFLGTLLEISDDAITSWFTQTKIYNNIWDRLDDDESYVRETCLNALCKLSKNCSLWNDFMEHYSLSETDIIKRVRAILLKDPGGFARRAAISLLCSWLKEDNWMRSSLLLSPQWKSDETAVSDENCSSIPEVVFTSVIAASRDLDWEVKLSSLEFWGEFLQAVIPEFVLPDVDVGKSNSCSNHCNVEDRGDCEYNERRVKKVIPNSEGEEAFLRCETNIPQYASMLEGLGGIGHDRTTKIEGSIAKSNNYKRTHLGSPNNCATPVNWIEILDEHICVRLLFEKLGDEDRTVCSRACEILLGLHDHLTRVYDEYGGNLKKEVKFGSSEDRSCLEHILSLIAEHKVDVKLNGCLEGSHEKMSSLLEEILSAASLSSEKKINIDCY